MKISKSTLGAICSIFYCSLILTSCNNKQQSEQIVKVSKEIQIAPLDKTSIVILGTVQDAGSPHIACKKECCSALFDKPNPMRKVVSLGLVDAINDKTYLFEATPDITSQLKTLRKFSKTSREVPSGIFLTHAHIGHYTGLMYLGKEATNASNAPVFAMPGMKNFLEANGPWSQLVRNKNIVISEMENNQKMVISEEIYVTPFVVPHRDEFSETVGYTIQGPHKSALFIPDIDKWEKWDASIIAAISVVDYAFLDATFYDGAEISRDISEIPHPFIIESMEKFKDLPISEKNKIYFIHFNHTNPVLDITSRAYQTVIENGFHVAQALDVINL